MGHFGTFPRCVRNHSPISKPHVRSTSPPRSPTGSMSSHPVLGLTGGMTTCLPAAGAVRCREPTPDTEGAAKRSTGVLLRLRRNGVGRCPLRRAVLSAPLRRPSRGRRPNNHWYWASKLPVIELYPDGPSLRANDFPETQLPLDTDYAAPATACGGTGRRCASHKRSTMDPVGACTVRQRPLRGIGRSAPTTLINMGTPAVHAISSTPPHPRLSV